MRLKTFNYKSVQSTNNVAINIIKKTKNKSGIIIAEKQIDGRGQYGKKWISYKGNLFATIFFSINKINISLKEFTYVNCTLIRKLISIFYKENIIIKRPNDLLINGKKVCGILQETIYKSNEKFIIIGIGLNIIKSPNIKNYPTTNLYEITNKKIDIHKVIFSLKKIYETFIPISKKINIKNIDKLVK